MLLSGSCEVLGLEERAGLDFVVRDLETHDVSVVGWPARDAITEAVSRRKSRGVVLAQFDNQGPVVAALPGWRKTAATLHVLSDARRVPSAPLADVRLLTRRDLGSLSLPPELQSEFEIAIRHSPIAATIVDGAPVSFCYAASVTESLWDVSIDTLEAHRRRGYATQCVAYMINYMLRRGKRPVWGALETNAPSLELALKLGFEPVDRIVVFEAADRG